METNVAKTNLPESKLQSNYYRFQVFTGRINPQGKAEKDKSVGVAYHESGLKNYFLRIWLWPDTSFFLSPSEKDPSLYFVKTKVPLKRPSEQGDYHWIIVGSGRVNPRAGVIQFNLDLVDKQIFMSIFPDQVTPKAETPNL